jgi:hypothetical protein
VCFEAHSIKCEYVSNGHFECSVLIISENGQILCAHATADSLVR